MCLFYCSSKTTLVSNAKTKITKSNKSELCKPFVIQSSILLFRGWQLNLQKLLQNFEVVTSKFNIKHPLTSMASKNSSTKIFENILRSMQIIQILMGGMNFRKRLQKNQMSSAVRSESFSPWQIFHTPPRTHFISGLNS